MIDTIILIGIGAFIGWNFPQPPWAVWFQTWVKGLWTRFTTKKDA